MPIQRRRHDNKDTNAFQPELDKAQPGRGESLQRSDFKTALSLIKQPFLLIKYSIKLYKYSIKGYICALGWCINDYEKMK